MPNKILTIREAATVWTPTGNPAFDVRSLGNGSGRVGARVELAPAAAADRYIWRCKVSLGVAAAVGAFASLYLVSSDGTDADGNLGTTDAALPSTDRRRNLQWIGSVIADAATVGPFKNSGVIEIISRYVQPVIYNEFNQAFSAVVADHSFSLQPAPLEVQ